MKIARLMRVLTSGTALLALVFASGAVPGAHEQPPPGAANAWLIFIDDLHVDFRNTGRLRALIETIVTTLVAAGDYSAGVSSGPSAIELDPSLDRTRLLARTKNATGSALRAADIARLLREARPSDEVLYRAVVSLSTASDAVAKFEHLAPTGRAIVYISNGYGVEPASDSGPAIPRDVRGAPSNGIRETADAVRQRLAGLVARARRAGVTIFAVDARRLRGDNSDPVDLSPEGLRYRANARASLRAISDGTGGFAILEEQALADSLANISRAMRR
jgi:hypothetical protein